VVSLRTDMGISLSNFSQEALLIRGKMRDQDTRHSSARVQTRLIALPMALYFLFFEMFQSGRLANVHSLHSFQVRLPSRGSDCDKTTRADRVDCSIMVVAVGKLDLFSIAHLHRKSASAQDRYPIDAITSAQLGITLENSCFL